jgi:formylmethanofuran--tetrahydromethanopterin N-formyltransferase
MKYIISSPGLIDATIEAHSSAFLRKTHAGYIRRNVSNVAGRLLITAENEKWATNAAKSTIGFATSIIMSPAEAGIEGVVPAEKTPDGRSGVIIQIYHRSRLDLKAQLLLRIGQCVMTCPTTSAFDALPEAKRR